MLGLLIGCSGADNNAAPESPADPITELSRLLNDEGLIYIPEIRDSVNAALEDSFTDSATRPDQVRDLIRWVEEWRDAHPAEASKARQTLRLAQDAMDNKLRTKP